MLGIVLSGVTWAFCLYFWYIGVWRLGIIPIALLATFTGSYFLTLTHHKDGTTSQLTSFINEYSLLFAWLTLLAGVGVILNFFGMTLIGISITLLSANILLRLVSLNNSYEDGKKIFPISYQLLSLLALVLTVNQWWRAWGIVTLQGFILMNTALYATTTFVLSPFMEINKRHGYILFVLAQAMIMIIIANSTDNIYIGIGLAQLWMTGLYYGISQIQELHRYFEQTTHTVTARDILRWARVTNKELHRIAQRKELLNEAYTFIKEIPQSIKALCSILNIIIIATIMSLFFRDFAAGKIEFLSMLIYRASIAVFFLNFFLLKTIKFYHEIQRVVVFFVINFAIYLSIINLFVDNNFSIAMIGIMRNVANSVLIFYADDIIPKGLLQFRDYWYWIGANILAMLINLRYLMRSNLNGQLLFGMIFLYLGIQAFLMYYNTKHVHKQKPAD